VISVGKIGLVVAFLVCLILGVAGYDWWRLQRTPEHLPELHFSTITGKQFSLSSLRGKPVLVTFWATTCPACIKEMPQLIELYQQYHAKGLEIIAITMAYDPPNHVVEMTREKGLPYDVVLDLHSSYIQAFGNIQITPNNFLIMPDGTIGLHKLGLLDMEKMRALLNNKLI
jgi:thiol-disulfide isomerase/thioredoxin